MISLILGIALFATATEPEVGNKPPTSVTRKVQNSRGPINILGYRKTIADRHQYICEPPYDHICFRVLMPEPGIQEYYIFQIPNDKGDVVEEIEVKDFVMSTNSDGVTVINCKFPNE